MQKQKLRLFGVFVFVNIITPNGRAAVVFSKEGHHVRGWGISERAVRSTLDAENKMQKWINQFRPEIIVVEHYGW